MIAIEKILPYYTYEDWVRWEGRWELIDGIPYAMSPAPVPGHQRLASKLNFLFELKFKDCETCTIYQPIDFVVANDTILQPDLLIVCDKIEKAFLDFPPALVIEIISPSTALKDRHTKFSIYQTQKVQYYIIVFPKTEEIEIYQLENDAYVLRQRSKEAPFTFYFRDCQGTIDFAEIW